MFEKFGEFDSVDELNMAAAGFVKEGDFDSVYKLAEENGIDKEDADDYLDGITEELATLPMAAQGRLDIEEEDKTIKDAMEKMAMSVIMLMLRGMCESEEMQQAVLKKGKRAKNILQAMRAEAKKNASGGMGISCGTDRQLRGIIKSYYLDTEEQFRQKIADLYK